MEPTIYIYFQVSDISIDTAINGQFPGEYVILQLQICTAFVLSAADYIEGSCSFNIG